MLALLGFMASYRLLKFQLIFIIFFNAIFLYFFLFLLVVAVVLFDYALADLVGFSDSKHVVCSNFACLVG